MCLFSEVFSECIRKVKVRNGVYAYKYRNGVINIAGSKYALYSMKDAIKKWRTNNPK
jgi:hypothetical protein